MSDASEFDLECAAAEVRIKRERDRLKLYHSRPGDPEAVEEWPTCPVCGASFDSQQRDEDTDEITCLECFAKYRME